MSEREPNLDVHVEIRDARTAVLSVRGELDMETAGRLDEHLAEQVGGGGTISSSTCPSSASWTRRA